MQRTLVVTGKSLEQALERASVLLHCDVPQIGYEIVQEGKWSRTGALEAPFKLRVMAVTDSPDQIELDPEEAEFTPDQPWLAKTLEPLSPEIYCRGLREILADAVNYHFDDNALPPQPAGSEAPLEEIGGNLSGSDGKIEFDGHVRIFGNVTKGAVIKASGRIQVVGEVETALLQACGDITIGGGLLGTAVSTAGSVTCKFVQGGKIHAPFGNITIAESAMQPNLHAGKRVKIGDALLGGTCYGEQHVDLGVVGSELGVPTTVIAGLNKRLNDRIEEIRLRVDRNMVRLNECDKLRKELLPIEEGGEQLPTEDRVRLWKFTIRRGRVQADLIRLAAEKQRLLGLVNSERSARICIKKRVCPKVKIIIDDSALEIRNVTQYVTFSKDYDSGGAIRVTSYQ